MINRLPTAPSLRRSVQLATSFAAAFLFAVTFTNSQNIAVAKDLSAGAARGAPATSAGSAPVLPSSLMPANRFGMNEGGVGDVSDEYYACVGKRYGGEFRARIANLQRKGRALTYESLLNITAPITQKAQYCADQERGAKFNIRRMIQALEAN